MNINTYAQNRINKIMGDSSMSPIKQYYLTLNIEYSLLAYNTGTITKDQAIDEISKNDIPISLEDIKFYYDIQEIKRQRAKWNSIKSNKNI